MVPTFWDNKMAVVLVPGFWGTQGLIPLGLIPGSGIPSVNRYCPAVFQSGCTRTIALG